MSGGVAARAGAGDAGRRPAGHDQSELLALAAALAEQRLARLPGGFHHGLGVHRRFAEPAGAGCRLGYRTDFVRRRIFRGVSWPRAGAVALRFDSTQEVGMSLAMYEAQQHHGATSRGLCIPDTGIHRARLQLAAEMLVEQDVSDVLDLGCGFGELADLLNANVRYIGVDQTLWILALARE